MLDLRFSFKALPLGRIAVGLMILALFWGARAVAAEKPARLPDYKALRTSCAENGCCLESVRRMEEGSFPLAKTAGKANIKTEDRCPPGFRHQMLKCPDSLEWCEPKRVGQ